MKRQTTNWEKIIAMLISAKDFYAEYLSICIIYMLYVVYNYIINNYIIYNKCNKLIIIIILYNDIYTLLQMKKIDNTIKSRQRI